AASAALEAAEALVATIPDCRITTIRGGFDEYNFNIELLHTGAPLFLGTGRHQAPQNLLDLDDKDYTEALDQTLKGVSQALLARLADRTTSGRRNSTSWLRLHFDH